ncbi:MAG: hypothetical protein Aureis2KO_23640 [Aureisphaera sp.]
MKNRIAIPLGLFIFLFISGNLYAQKDYQRIESGKNLRNTVLYILRTAKKEKSNPKTCDASGLLKSIPRKKLVASKEDLAKEINRIMDTILLPDEHLMLQGKYGHLAFEVFGNSKKVEDYAFGIFVKRYKDIEPAKQKIIKKHFDRLSRFFKKGIDLKPVTFKHKGCDITSTTNLTPLSWKQGYRKRPSFMTINWKITLELKINCPCNEKNKHKVKQAIYRYQGKSSGPYTRFTGDIIKGVKGFGVRFGKVSEAKYKRTKLECCPEKTNPPEDGSYISPDEDISHENIFIDANVGISLANDEETEMIGATGILFYMTSIANNPFYLGPKATIQTTALNGNDIKATRTLIGPVVEYQIPIGQGNTHILGGIHSGYSFGSIDSFGFKQTTSGFAVNLYSGVEMKLTEKVALGLLLNLFEYNNTQFKAEEGGMKTNSSNALFITDRATVSLGARIDLD